MEKFSGARSPWKLFLARLDDRIEQIVDNRFRLEVNTAMFDDVSRRIEKIEADNRMGVLFRPGVAK